MFIFFFYKMLYSFILYFWIENPRYKYKIPIIYIFMILINYFIVNKNHIVVNIKNFKLIHNFYNKILFLYLEYKSITCI